jgi:hypothetical protein
MTTGQYVCHPRTVVTILSSALHRGLFVGQVRRGAQWSGRKGFGERQRVLLRNVFRALRPLSVALFAARHRPYCEGDEGWVKMRFSNAGGVSASAASGAAGYSSWPGNVQRCLGAGAGVVLWAARGALLTWTPVGSGPDSLGPDPTGGFTLYAASARYWL